MQEAATLPDGKPAGGGGRRGADSMSPSRLDKAAAVIAMGISGAIQKGRKKQRTVVTRLLVGV